MRTFEDKQATRESVPLLVGLMGPSGGGKTYSGLRLATGIQQVHGGDIHVIDTEARRALHYADYFKFRHIDFKAPFGSLDYLEAIDYCVGKGAGVVLIDSMSHEHSGVGGYLETAEAELTRMAGDNYGKRQSCKLLSYAKPSKERRKMVDRILQHNTNFIFCFRAKEKVKPVKKDGKSEIESLGFMPIAGEELVFEMTVCALLMPHAGGVPTWSSAEIGERMMIKQARQFESLFAEQRPMDERHGIALAEWARGSKPQDLTAIIKAGDAAADLGTEALKTWWESISNDQRKALKTNLEAWKIKSGATK